MKGPLQIMKKAMRKNSDSFLQSSVQSVQRHNPAEFVNRLKDYMLYYTAVANTFLMNDERSATVNLFHGCQVTINYNIASTDVPVSDSF